MTDQTSNERLARLRILAASSIVGADLKWLLERYELLRAVATPIAEALRQVGDETDWRDGDETDRVYAWHEMEALWKALADSPAVETVSEPKPIAWASKTGEVITHAERMRTNYPGRLDFFCVPLFPRAAVKTKCEHQHQRQGERGPPYCADCGAQVET